MRARASGRVVARSSAACRIGGLIALRFAARASERACGAGAGLGARRRAARPTRGIGFYVRAPWLLVPLFCVDVAVADCARSSRAALPSWRERPAGSRVAHGGLRRIATSRRALMRDRVRLLDGVDFRRRMSRDHRADAGRSPASRSSITSCRPTHTRRYLELRAGARAVYARAHRTSRHDHAARARSPRIGAPPSSLASADGAGGRIGQESGQLTDEPCRSARLPDPPAASRRCSSAPALDAQAEPVRAAVVFAHPHPLNGGTMHTKAVYRATKALGAHRLRGAALQLPRRRRERRARSTTASARWTTSAPALDFMRDALSGRAAVGGGLLVRLVGRADGRRRDDPRVTTLIGIAPPLDRYDFARARRARSRSSSSRASSTRSARSKDVRAFYAQAAEPKELVVIDAARPPVRRQGRARWATRSRICSETRSGRD